MIKKFTCKQCGKKCEKWHTPSVTAPGQTVKYLFCSRQCSSASRKSKVELECLICLKKFEVWPARAKTRKYCNKKCQNIATGLRFKGKLNNPIEVSCGYCGKVNIVPDHVVNAGQGKFCDKICCDKFKVGKPGANLGKTFPQMSGKNHHAWRGGVTPENEKLRKGRKYASWRKAVFARDNYTCQDCEQRGGVLNADHIKPFALYPELRFEIDNGRTLCAPCHRKTPTWGYGTIKLMKQAATLASARTRRLN